MKPLKQAEQANLISSELKPFAASHQTQRRDHVSFQLFVWECAVILFVFTDGARNNKSPERIFLSQKYF